MRYVIVSVVDGDAGDFNNNLRKDIFYKFKAKSSKLPAHFTIKSPFEADNIDDLIKALSNFTSKHKSAPYKIKGYDRFDNRVIFMKVIMSDEGQNIHNKLIDDLSKLPYINFNNKDGKDKIFHVTICSKKIQPIFSELWNYISQYSCNFNCEFNNISIFKWENNTWILFKSFFF